jgi:hypothetical protein
MKYTDIDIKNIYNVTNYINLIRIKLYYIIEVLLLDKVVS